MATLFAALCAAAAVSTLTAQTTVTIPCDRDNTLYESATGSLSNARGTGLFVGLTGQASNGRRRTLMHFDVSAHIPAGARVLAATLQLNVSRTVVPASFDVTGHRVTRAWGEGTSNAPGQEGGGTSATTNDATWRHAFYPTTLWTNLGGDFVAAPSFSISTPWNGLATSLPASGMNADVQHWLNNPAQNFGWLLRTDELLQYMTRRFDSRETTAPSIPPSLTVIYVLPGQLAATWGLGCMVGGQPYQHTLTGLPLGGSTGHLVQTNGPPGALAANLLSVSFDPVGFPLLPGCPLYLPLGGTIVTHSLVLLDPAGFASTPLPLPIGFPGLLLVGQAAALASNPQGYVLSNAWLAVLN